MGTHTYLRLPRTPFLDAVRKSGLLTPDDLVAVLTAETVDEATLADPIRFAALLVRKKLLTKFQAMQLLNGKTQGFRLDHYTILDGVRQDRVGMVFLAEDTRTRRPVWVKVLPTDRVSDRMILEAFAAEVQAAARVSHAHLARVLGMGMHGGTYYVVSEPAPGPTLDRLLAAKGPLAAHTAARHVAQVAVALRHAHRLGLTHRDVKPANVAVGVDGRAKLLDLGLTHMLESPWAKVTRRISTKEYAEEIDHIAPEQAWGCEPDARSDVYSLGSTFYTLLTGRSPFPGSAAEKMQQRQLHGVPAPSKTRPGLPRELDAVVLKMAAKDPHERYRSAAEVVAALQPWLPVAEWPALGLGPSEAKAKPAAPTDRPEGTSMWTTLTGLFKRAK
ncbi:MAG TPA: serine/threonine-protein kinase [Fimbriiglobus sp.]|nr:serine/threonine-protein kinase [Fimbriiglobus sp.]